MKGLFPWMWAAALACAPKAVPSLPSTEAIQIPAGCATDLSGQYTHQVDADYRYLALDDGGSLAVAVERGDGPSPSADGGTAILLRRTPQGFVGQTIARGYAQSGASCDVHFPTEVTSCAQGRLTLRAALKVSIDDRCQVDLASPPSRLEEQVLVRQSFAAPGLDGGSVK